MKGYQPKESNVKQTPPNEGSSVISPSNINSGDGQNTLATGNSYAGSSTTVNPPMSYGWICPKCGRVNAPWKSHCDCNGGNGPIWKFDYDDLLYKEYKLPKGPTEPYEWGDTPGWWNQGPTCETIPKEGKLVISIEYPDGHIEKCPVNYFAGAGDPIPCALTPGDPNLGRSESISNKISSQTGGDPNIKAYS